MSIESLRTKTHKLLSENMRLRKKSKKYKPYKKETVARYRKKINKGDKTEVVKLSRMFIHQNDKMQFPKRRLKRVDIIENGKVQSFKIGKNMFPKNFNSKNVKQSQNVKIVLSDEFQK